MRILVTGAGGFLGWRSTVLLSERGHDVLALTRPGGAARAQARELEAVEADAGSPEVRVLLAGRDAVLHFAGVPDPDRARRDPARAVRENAGATLNLLEGCAQHGCRLVYPSTIRAAGERPPDPYALSKRLGEEACRLHRAPATIVRLTSVYGPGQVAWEGATGAIAAFAARALCDEPIVIPGDPARTRDFVYVDDAVAGIEAVAGGAHDGVLILSSGAPAALLQVAELVREAAGSRSEIQLPGGNLPAGENVSYEAPPESAPLRCDVRPLEEGIALYVDWLRRHPAAQGRARG